MTYVLWRVGNGWLVTGSATIWENKIPEYLVFHSLAEFCEHVAERKPEKKPKKGRGSK